MRLLCTLLAALFIFNAANAQKKNPFSPADTKNNVKLGLNTNFTDSYPFALSWEFKVANKQSLQIDVLPVFYKDNYSTENGLSLGLSYRKYISKNKEGLQGLYISPLVNYNFSNYSSDYNKTNDKTINFAFLFGNQWVYKSGFSLDINGGLGFYTNKSEGTNNGYYYPGYNPRPYSNNNYGITPNLNIKIGYAF